MATFQEIVQKAIRKKGSSHVTIVGKKGIFQEIVPKEANVEEECADNGKMEIAHMVTDADFHMERMIREEEVEVEEAGDMEVEGGIFVGNIKRDIVIMVIAASFLMKIQVMNQMEVKIVGKEVMNVIDVGNKVTMLVNALIMTIRIDVELNATSVESLVISPSSATVRGINAVEVEEEEFAINIKMVSVAMEKDVDFHMRVEVIAGDQEVGLTVVD